MPHRDDSPRVKLESMIGKTSSGRMEGAIVPRGCATSFPVAPVGVRAVGLPPGIPSDRRTPVWGYRGHDGPPTTRGVGEWPPFGQCASVRVPAGPNGAGGPGGAPAHWRTGSGLPQCFSSSMTAGGAYTSPEFAEKLDESVREKFRELQEAIVRARARERGMCSPVPFHANPEVSKMDN